MRGNFDTSILNEDKRIIQEYGPGCQLTLAHIIASPDPILYKKLGLDPRIDYEKAAIGVTTVTPSETAIIMADVALKASGITVKILTAVMDKLHQRYGC